MDLIKTFAGALAVTFIAPLSSFAQLPVAPFTAPSELVIPPNMPGIRPGVYRLAPWRSYKTRDKFREDFYIQSSRKRGSIVSFYTIERRLRAESDQDNRYSSRYGEGAFLPSYSVALERYDCQNDQRMSDPHVVYITDAFGDRGKEGGFIYPTDRYEKNWEVTPGQVKVLLEGRPYWAMLPGNDPRHFQNKSEPEWRRIIPGTYGASHLDYACDYL